MKILLSISFLSCLFLDISYAQTNTQLVVEPKWVLNENINYDLANIEYESGGLEYLFIDIQDHIEEETEYYRVVFRITNSEGLRSSSDIQIEYDPTYQKLNWHEVRIIRDGKIINKFDSDRIQLLRNENDMDRYIYDGSETAVLNLTDVRIGDLIDYSYSSKGFNPIHKEEYFFNLKLNAGSSYHKLRYRLLADSDRVISINTRNNPPDSTLTKLRNITEYTWIAENVKGLTPEGSTPGWFNPYQTINISTFEAWSDVINWALPHYSFSSNNETFSFLEFGLDSDLTNKEDVILKAIQFVQDDVRYLGFESGISAYKPNNPIDVLNRRFGDCKDKSVLLIEILRSMNIEASPIFVNTSETIGIERLLPSPTAFDHVVVTFKYNDKDYYVDPTISNQGGNLSNYFFPNYAKGLIIKEGIQSLTDLPSPTSSLIKSNETINISSIGKGASYKIVTDYYGEHADFQRSMLQQRSISELSESYLNYYSNLFPSIQAVSDIELIDQRNGENKLRMVENYIIKDLWNAINGDSTNIQAEYYPMVLSSYIGSGVNFDRKTPYYLGKPFKYEQVTTINLPEEWEITPSVTKYGTDAFNYIYSIKKVGEKTALLEYKMQFNKEWIASDDVVEFVGEQSKIEDNLGFILTYDKNFNSSSISWLALLVFCASLIVAGFIAQSVHVSYNPAPKNNLRIYPRIGGWLFFIFFGLIMTPFSILYELFYNSEIFNSNILFILLDSSSLSYNPELAYFILLELVFNSITLVFALLLITQFITKRTSAPKLVMIFLGFNFLIQMIDIGMASLLMPGIFSQYELNEFYGEALRSFFVCCIWIPYFNISKRVESTFVRIFEVNSTQVIIDKAKLQKVN